MASSRVRVCVALYSQLVAFVAAPIIFRTLLYNWPGVLASGAAVATALVWWLGVFRDHQKDDLKYLQGHISIVAAQLVKLERFKSRLQLQQGSVELLGYAARVREKGNSICNRLKGMLEEMKEREARLCKRFRGQ
jgi:hypothetical protein